MQRIGATRRPSSSSRYGAAPGGAPASSIKRPALRRRGIRIARHVSGRSIENRRRVAHRTRHDVLDGEAVPGSPVSGPNDTRPREGLSPDQAAFARRNPNRAAAVVGVRDRDHPRRNGCRGTAAGTSGRASQIPGIARRTEGLGLGGRDESELRSVGFAETDEPCGFELRGQIGVTGRDKVASRRTSSPCREGRLRGRSESFIRKGTPRKGPSGIAPLFACARA